MIDTKALLTAAIERRLQGMSAEVGESTTLLARETLRLIEDPAVIAAHPAECRMLAERRDRARVARSARRLTVWVEV